MDSAGKRKVVKARQSHRAKSLKRKRVMIISLCKNEWITALIWKSGFDIWLVNEALNLLLYRLETKEDNEK